MNAFPAELIQHHYACMLVAGLLPPPPPPSKQAAAATTPEGERTELGEGTTESIAGPSQQRQTTPSEEFPQLAKDLCEIFSSRGRSTAWDPARGKSAVFHAILVDHNVRLPPRKTRPTLRTLAAQTTGQQSAAASLAPRSPLSPLHPSSPLFPDGIIAPIWLRKHRDLIPSVFVAFYCLVEHSDEPPPAPPKDNDTATTGAEAVEGQTLSRGPDEIDVNASDEALIKSIFERKRSLSERGIKFTVVLLTRRSMLESPTLEQRLSYIRRSSQLDSRASLFVLTPVSKEELGEFVTSLQTALYDPALDYYREHYRRVRRKRAKYPPPPSIVTQIFSAAADLRGSPVKDNALSKEGWLARNDYKLGTFAELTGNLDDALTHYTNAYQLLSVQLLPSTLLLPPRTKRWAEAKVLADTLSLRIAKILLYRDDGEGAWEQFRTHVKKFTELSQGWGIGEMTFEYWSWLAKQYRLMGDLLDLAMRDVPGAPIAPFRPAVHFPPMPTFLLHPSHLPTPTASGSVTPSFNSQHGNLAAPNDAAMASNVVPVELCLGAGDCFYVAGVCSLERWERFKRLQWEEDQKQVDKTSTDKAAESSENWNSSALAQEHKVDHAGQAIEALTRAHEVLKRQQRHRFALFVASKIANAYVESKQSELALRFLERTAKSYDFERWPTLLVSQLLSALQCAQEVKDVESETRALWRLLSASVSLRPEQRENALHALVENVAKQKSFKAGKGPLHLEWAEGDGPLDVKITFSQENVNLDGKAVPFQLRISSLPHGGLAGVTFDRLKLFINDDSDEEVIVTVRNSSDVLPTQTHFTSIQTIDLRAHNSIESEGDIASSPLTWSDGTVLVFEGRLVPRRTGSVSVRTLSLEKDGLAPFSLDFRQAGPEQSRADIVQPLWLVNTQPPRLVSLPSQTNDGKLQVNGRKYNIKVSLDHEPEAYVDEIFTIAVHVVNEDDVEVECQLDLHVLCPPGEIISTDEVWALGDERTMDRVNSLRDVGLGRLQAGASAQRTFSIMCRRHLAIRTVDVVVKTRAPSEPSETSLTSSGLDTETVCSTTIPVKPIFASSYYAQWRLVRDNKAANAARRASNVLDSVKQEGNGEDEAEDVTTVSVMADELAFITAIASLNVAVGVLAVQEIELTSVSLLLDAESKHLRLWRASNNKSQSAEIAVGGAWKHGDRWGGVFDVEVLSENAAGTAIEAEDASLRPTGKLVVSWRRRKVESSSSNTSVLSLPLLLPPHLLARLVVSLPSSTSAEQPLVMLITIVNPSRLAADIVISIDDSHSDFGIQSHRTFTVPNLLPRSTRSVPVHLAARRTSGKGFATIRTLPNVRAWQRDRRQNAGQTASESARTSMESTPAATSTTTTTTGAGSTTISASRQEELLKIVNQRSGAGVPLEVSLRYTAKTAGGVAAPITGSSVLLPSHAAAAVISDQRANDEKRIDSTHAHEDVEGTSGIAAAGTTVDIVSHLQAETQRTGLWTILVQ